MAGFGDLSKWSGTTSALPPVTAVLILTELEDHGEQQPASAIDEPQPISAFVCIIDYDGDTRLITCRRYERIGELSYVGAICHAAKGYRQFRCDRIQSVYDVSTGELLGGGAYFERFALDSQRDRAPTWGLTPSHKSTLVAGLNILAFMARCDGHWHRLETDVIERFVCSMWLRKEWEGDPPVDEIVAHAQRLSPDADIFFKSLRHYASSATSTRLICRAIGDLIAADGVICSSEASWATEIDAFFGEYREEEFSKVFASGEPALVVINSPAR